MFTKLSGALFCCLLLHGACGSKDGGTQPASSGAAPASSINSLAGTNGTTTANTTFDACSLIDKSEIASVQGVQVQQAQPSGQRSGDLEIAQCYYSAVSADGTKNLSVHLQAIHPDPNSARSDAVKEFWEERFGPEGRERRKGVKEREEEEEEGIRPPLPVSGIGDQAFWLGSDRGGALYVRKQDKVIRVSVGGPDVAKNKIEKSKTLARKALARLK